MDFTLLRTFPDYIRAHIALGILQENNINCWLKDENTVTIDPILGYAIGGIKLMVTNDQLEDATKILTQLEEEKRKKYTCPNCGSNNIEYITSNRKTINWLSSFVTWLFSSYAIGVEQVWHCFDCKTEFNEPVENDIIEFENEDYPTNADE